MIQPPVRYTDVEKCVEDTLSKVGRHIVLGTPLGLGKANHLVNEFYRRAKDDPSIDLRIFTALTLGRPGWTSDLERRFVEPLAERLFGGYPELEYLEPLKQGKLPNNIRVSEFYFQPGSCLESPLAQKSYISSNYSHAVRDVLDAGINVLAQLIAKESQDSGSQAQDRFSLSCNSDLTLDLVPAMREIERNGKSVAILGQVNRELPFMFGEAAVGAGYFDAVLDDPKYEFPLFGTPNRPVSTADYMLALYVSALVRDGGTIQIGIGALGHAITYMLQLRHERNQLYRELLERAGALARFGDVIERVGGTQPFERGLYASSEMFVDGFIELYRSGILRRKVSDQNGAEYIAHACFFLGPRSFYESLREMAPAEREQISMTSISYVNELYGQEESKRRQRRDARFINSGLVVTLDGAVGSDALDDGRTVSGVGGQYNFVAMAHALDDGRSILMIPSTEDVEGEILSNFRLSYTQTTIPRHLRDLVVSEYGIAELRGKSTEEVAVALIEIANSRYQDDLLGDAVRGGRVSGKYVIPDHAQNNRPDSLDETLAPYREQGLFPEFPFGTELTDTEVVLTKALAALQKILKGRDLGLPEFGEMWKTIAIPDSAQSYLKRMDLADPRDPFEFLMQRALVYSLASVEAI